MKKIKFMIIIFLLIIYMYISNIILMPNEITILKGDNFEIKKLYGIKIIDIAETSNNSINSRNLEVSFFGIKLKDINVNIIEDIEVVPIGKIIGLKLYTNGVLIVGMSEIEDMNNVVQKPYENSNIQEGDTILKINENEINDISDLKKVLNDSNGNKILITLIRDGSILTSNITPIKTKDNEYKLGLWVKDAATGVGTITFYEPESKCFGALGHGITDSDTDKLIDIDSGEIVTSKILSIKKGEVGNPGEIKGTILNQRTLGTVYKNTQFGIYGILNNLTSLNLDSQKAISVAKRSEIKEGEATILCSLYGDVPKEYKIEIQKIYFNNNSDNKSMLIRVKDEKLIEETGGIIRGLSGAPIIQNGKFVGAVTNVLVSNPEIGYGIFGDIMIKNMIY